MGKFNSACVIGHTIQHSRSPLIHGYWLHQHSIHGVYARVDVEENDFVNFINSLQNNGYIGANITIPYKELAFQCSEIIKDKISSRIGAINTIWYENGKLHGTNSDGIGFLLSLDHQLMGWDKQLDSVLIIGAGGATRAIIDALYMRGAKTIFIHNRTIEKAEILNSFFDDRLNVIQNTDGLKEAYKYSNLIVNTTSLGLDGVSRPNDYFEYCNANTCVTDIVYTPLETPFLQTAKRHNLRTAHGLDMLLFQAKIGFEKWFGVIPEVDDSLRALVLEDIRVKR